MAHGMTINNDNLTLVRLYYIMNKPFLLNTIAI